MSSHKNGWTGEEQEADQLSDKTYGQAAAYGRAYLEEHSIEDAGTDAWYLLSHVSGFSRTEYFLNTGGKMPQDQWEKYRRLLVQRSERIPLQHILGVWEFMGYEFIVNEHVLIPRQDTETLVIEALDFLEKNLPVKSGTMKMLDMCTGSGCVPVSVFRQMQEKYGEADLPLEITASDISGRALSVARGNGEKLNAAVNWVESDLFSNIAGEYDLITSNPPYIKTDEIVLLAPEVSEHDPFIALDGGSDGLYFYRRIAKEAPRHLRKGSALIMEIGHDQGADVMEILVQAGFSKIRIKKDMAGLDRVICAVYDK